MMVKKTGKIEDDCEYGDYDEWYYQHGNNDDSRPPPSSNPTPILSKCDVPCHRRHATRCSLLRVTSHLPAVT